MTFLELPWCQDTPHTREGGRWVKLWNWKLGRGKLEASMEAYPRQLVWLLGTTFALGFPLKGSETAGSVPRATVVEAAMVLDSAGQSLARMYEEVADSVVVVDSPPSTENSSEWDDRGRSADTGREQDEGEELVETGSGVVFTEDGHILTNYHVVENSLEDTVRVKTRDGGIKQAKIVGTDYKTDLAVLKLPAPYPPAIRMGDSDLVRPGNFVAAIGSPYGLDYSLTLGIVSGRGRNPLTGSAYEDYIQTDAAINPGNSGGPLLNMRGEWIGVNTLMNGINRGLGFSIPSNQAARIGLEIIKRGSVTRPWIGIRASRPVGMSDQSGVEVEWAGEGSPAARAGLRRGDIIVKINGVEVSNPSQLQREIWNTGVGKRMVVDFVRGGKARQRTVETIPMPNVGP